MFPSPSSQTVHVTYSLTEPAIVSLEMFSENGELVSKKELGRQVAGDFNFDFDLSNVASGNYFIRFSNAEKFKTVKFTVSH